MDFLTIQRFVFILVNYFTYIENLQAKYIHIWFQAFKDAWEDTCNYIGSQSTMEIPEGYTFLLQPIEFHGPCKSKKIILSVCITHIHTHI